MSGNLVTIISEAGSAVFLVAFALFVCKWLARRLDAAEARQAQLVERVLRQAGVPPADPGDGAVSQGSTRQE